MPSFATGVEASRWTNKRRACLSDGLLRRLPRRLIDSINAGRTRLFAFNQNYEWFSSFNRLGGLMGSGTTGRCSYCRYRATGNLILVAQNGAKCPLASTVSCTMQSRHTSSQRWCLGQMAACFAGRIDPMAVWVNQRLQHTGTRIRGHGWMVCC